jgi:branched-subunit amino acid permease
VRFIKSFGDSTGKITKNIVGLLGNNSILSKTLYKFCLFSPNSIILNQTEILNFVGKIEDPVSLVILIETY